MSDWPRIWATGFSGSCIAFSVISVFSQDWFPLGYAFFCLLMLCVVCVMDVRRNLATSAPGAPGRGELIREDEGQDSDEARL